MKAKAKKLFPTLLLIAFLSLQLHFFYWLTNGYDFLKKHTTVPVDGVCVGMSESEVREINNNYLSPAKLTPSEELSQIYPEIKFALVYENLSYLDLKGTSIYFFDVDDKLHASVFSPNKNIFEDEDIQTYRRILNKKYGYKRGAYFNDGQLVENGNGNNSNRYVLGGWTLKNPYGDGTYARNYDFYFIVVFNNEKRFGNSYFIIKRKPENQFYYYNGMDYRDFIVLFDDYSAFGKAAENGL